ncbi:MAG: hypothetical protein ACJA06_001496 [Halocynthiibacter sp.]|jgi:hypothetical protein
MRASRPSFAPHSAQFCRLFHAGLALGKRFNEAQMHNQRDQNTLRSKGAAQNQSELQAEREANLRAEFQATSVIDAPLESPSVSADQTASARPVQTEACLLYRHLPMQDDRRLQSLLERHGLKPIEAQVQHLAPNAPIEQHFQSETHRLTFTHSATPHCASDFQDALRSPYLGAYLGMMASMIERHESFMTLNITALSPEPQTAASYTEQLRLLHALTRAIARATSPMALYWSASSQILTGAQYSALIRVDAPWALFVHPIPQAAGTDREGRALTELRFEGAEHFLGQKVSLAPSALPRADIMRLGLGFIQYCAERQTLIAPGESLGKDRNARVERGPAKDRVDLVARVSHRLLPPPPSNQDYPPTPPRWRSVFVLGGVIAASLALVLGFTLTATGMRAPAQSLALSEITTTVLPAQN